MKRTNLNNEIEKTLASWDKVERSVLNSDFDEELHQKVAFLSRYETGSKWLKYSIAAMLLMALINGVLLMTWNTNMENNETQISSSLLYEPIDYTEFE